MAGGGHDRPRQGAHEQPRDEHPRHLVAALGAHGLAEHERQLRHHAQLGHGHDWEVGTGNEEQRARDEIRRRGIQDDAVGCGDAHEREVRGKGGVLLRAIENPAGEGFE